VVARTWAQRPARTARGAIRFRGRENPKVRFVLVGYSEAGQSPPAGGDMPECERAVQRGVAIRLIADAHGCRRGRHAGGGGSLALG